MKYVKDKIVESESYNFNNKKGMSLIALIVMILILLMLIGMSIYSLIENGSLKIMGLTKAKYNEERNIYNSTKMYATYEITEKNDNKGMAIIEFDSKNGIEYIKYVKDDEIVLQCNGKKNIAIDYDVEDKKEYMFKVKEIDKEEEQYVLYVKIDSQISEFQESEYFIIKEGGVELTRNVNIDYQYNDECKNYYSIDNGETWEEYKEELHFKESKTNLKLKTETDKNIITKRENKEICVQYAQDAVILREIDGNMEGVFGDKSYYMLVNNSAIGKRFNFTLSPNSLAWGMEVNVYFIDNDNNILSEKYNTVYSQSFSIEIPENATKIKFDVSQGYSISNVYVESNK